jgi:uncharacterized protein (DUF305 family)
VLAEIRTPERQIIAALETEIEQVNNWKAAWGGAAKAVQR